MTTRSLRTKRETQTQNGKRKSPEMGGGCLPPPLLRKAEAEGRAQGEERDGLHGRPAFRRFGLKQRRCSPPPPTASPCAALGHCFSPLNLSEARAGSSWLAAGLLGCTPEWHEPAGLSPARARLLTASFLLVNRCAPETLIAWSTTTACFRLLPFSDDLRADEAAGAGFEAQAGRSWSSS